MSHEEKNRSAAVARPPFLRFLPQSASWLPHTAATAPAAAATCAQHCKGYLTRSRPPRETNRGSASAPLLPAARAPPANQRTGRPLHPRPAGQVRTRNSRSRHGASQSACKTHRGGGARARGRGVGRKKGLGYPPIKGGLGAASPPLPRPLVASLWKPREAKVTARRGGGS